MRRGWIGDPPSRLPVRSSARLAVSPESERRADRRPTWYARAAIAPLERTSQIAQASRSSDVATAFTRSRSRWPDSSEPPIVCPIAKKTSCARRSSPRSRTAMRCAFASCSAPPAAANIAWASAPSSGYTAMPIDAETVMCWFSGIAVTDASAMRVATSPAIASARPRSHDGRISANSSPPQRATVPRSPTVSHMAAPIAVISPSPASWPKRSLTSLKSSRSIMTTAHGDPVRHASASWASKTSFRWR